MILTDDLEIHIIEIPKAIKSLNKNPNDRVSQWMLFLSDPNNREMLNIIKENKEIEEAMVKLKEVSEDEKIKRIAELKERARIDEISFRNGAIREGMRKGRREGRKIGIKEGIKIEQLEIAKRLINMKMEIELIMNATGLTKEEINNI